MALVERYAERNKVDKPDTPPAPAATPDYSNVHSLARFFNSP